MYSTLFLKFSKTKEQQQAKKNHISMNKITKTEKKLIEIVKINFKDKK